MKLWVAILALAGCGAHDKFEDSKKDLAKRAAQMLAKEAYPQWSATHPEKECPDSIDALAEYTGNKNAMSDPWGHPYILLCGPSAPKGVKGAGVISVGPDGRRDTDDDITSW